MSGAGPGGPPSPRSLARVRCSGTSVTAGEARPPLPSGTGASGAGWASRERSGGPRSRAALTAGRRVLARCHAADRLENFAVERHLRDERTQGSPDDGAGLAMDRRRYPSTGQRPGRGRMTSSSDPPAHGPRVFRDRVTSVISRRGIRAAQAPKAQRMRRSSGDLRDVDLGGMNPGWRGRRAGRPRNRPVRRGRDAFIGAPGISADQLQLHLV